MSSLPQFPPTEQIQSAIVKEEVDNEASGESAGGRRTIKEEPADDGYSSLPTPVVKEEDLAPKLKKAKTENSVPETSSCIAAIIKEEAEGVRDPLQCPFCPRAKYKTRCWFERHMQRHHQTPKSEGAFLCSICDERFEREFQRVNHYTEFHKITPKELFKYNCTVCRTPFYLEKNAFKCASQHEKGCVQCLYCPSMFLVRWLLVWHLEHFHGKPGHPCLVCRAEFAESTLLARHLMGPCALKDPLWNRMLKSPGNRVGCISRHTSREFDKFDFAMKLQSE